MAERDFIRAPPLEQTAQWDQVDARALLAAIHLGLRPTPLVTVAEWADKNRILDSNHPIPGPYSTALTPHWREVMEAMSPLHPCRGVAIKKAVQDGASDVAWNTIGTYIDNSPCPILVLLPTVADAQKASITRFAPMIAASPVLRGKIGEAKSRDGVNTILVKNFAGGAVYLVGSNSPSQLAQLSIRILIGDEIDRYALDAGGEGDPWSLAQGRISNFPNSKWLAISTPTDTDSKIEELFLAGDQRHRYLPCPRCGHFQTLRWEQMRWPKGETREAVYHCESDTCGGTWEHWENDALLPLGRWVAHAPENNPNDGDDSHRSYTISNMYKPSCLGMSWGRLAKKWEGCGKDPIKFQVFNNLHLAKVFNSAQYADLTGDKLKDRAEIYADDLPIVFVTMFCDVQNDRLEASIVGWGADEECWLHSHVILPGDPRLPEVWELLTVAYRRRYFGLPIAFAGIDSGYLPDEVDKYLRNFRNGRFVRTIGRANNTKGINRLPIWNPRAKIIRGKTTMLFTIGVDTGKHNIYSRLQALGAGPGMVHFPLGLAPDYYDQLTSEHVVKVKGVQRWQLKKPDARNEALDCLVGNLAMCKAYQIMKKKLPTRANRATDAELDAVLDQKTADLGESEGGDLQDSDNPDEIVGAGRDLISSIDVSPPTPQTVSAPAPIKRQPAPVDRRWDR